MEARSLSVKFNMELEAQGAEASRQVTRDNGENLGGSAQAAAPGAEMLDAKLDRNPCPFAFRMNYMALLYNVPLYGWIKTDYDLSRPEYVVLYSLAISGGGSSRDISLTSGFPKNTLSRAISRLEKLKLIERGAPEPGNGRLQPLALTPRGWDLYNETLPAFEAQERRMLDILSDDEKDTLFRLMSKVVRGSAEWVDTPLEEIETARAAEPGARKRRQA